MNNRALIFVIILVVFGAVVIIQQQQSINKVEQMESEAIAKVRNAEVEQAKQKALMAEKVKQQALEAARQAEAEAQKAKQMAMEEAKRMEEAARQKAEALKAKVSGLVAQAQSLLDSGKFQQAIDLAKTILGEDPGNLDAKSIMDKAMAKLKEAVLEQGAAITGEVKDVLQDADAGLKGLGQ